jgi:hypothetical protein
LLKTKTENRWEEEDVWEMMKKKPMQLLKSKTEDGWERRT